MAEDREQLVVDLIARVSEFERNMRRAEGVGTGSFSKLRQESARATQAMEQDFQRSTGRINQLLDTTRGHAASFAKGLLSSLAVPLTGAGVLATLGKIKNELLEMDRLAKASGLSITQAAGLRNLGTATGVSGAAIGSGLEGIAGKIAEAAREETEFGKLLEANGIKLKDRHGQVISTNEALNHAARLIANAANESDKIKIAEILGLSKEWVPLLERGADAFRAQRAEQERGVQGLEEAVKKAKAFDEAWNSAWGNFQVASKVALLDVGRGLGYLAEQVFSFVKGLNELRTFTVEQGPGTGIRLETPIPGLTNNRGELLPNFAPPAPRNRPTSADAGTPNLGPRTIIPPSGGGGGGGGASETDTAEKRLQSYTDSIARQTAVLEAQIATFGRSNAEKRAAEELARAAVDLNRLDASTRQTMTAKLMEQVQASEQARQRLEDLNKAQERTNQVSDANKEFFGSIFKGAATGKLGVDGLTSALDRLQTRMLDMAFDQFWESMFPKNRGAGGMGFGGLGLGLPNLLGEMAGLFGFMPAMADGGRINGPGTGRSDSILARVSNGEFITNAAATARHLPLLEAINGNRVPRFAEGGLVPPQVPASLAMPSAPEFGGSAMGRPQVNVNVVNNTPARVHTQQDTGGNITLTIEEVKDQIAGGIAADLTRKRGPVGSAITSSFGIPQNGGLIG
ncbi:MAG: hypothetical protein JNK84_14110 [Phreatobacter sp.]|uniref:hypothetical protein n=1 Tax=Phreatobacter sp. TaxID=1966341 RepID=UPI001A46C50E|nr:hypothetical protein [Phreatobacter sp.]MBL8570200.1 hypothetical protein [Phreatobacter sp.]